MEINKEKIKKLSSKRLEFSFFTFLLGFIDNIAIKDKQTNKEKNNSGDPIIALLTNFEEITKILNINEQIIFKYFYFNRKKITKILYDNEEISDFSNLVKIEKNISCYFYLDLLISENPEQVVDYKYSIDFIKDINNLQKNINDKRYQKIIISKIIIDLINNYKETDYFDEENDEILNEIENENNNIINNNITIFNEIGLNMTKENINSKKLDKAYIEIIIGLIKKNKIGDNEYINKIINELDLENISLTKTMFDELSSYLNSSENNLQDYIINNYDDLFKESIINFYYFLFKYILKNSIYIYQNTFLFKIRKNIFNFIKKKNEHNMSDIDTNLKDKIIYIINTFTDNKYYFENYINNSKIEDKEVVINTYQSSEVDTNLSRSNPFSFLSYINATRTKGEGLLLQSQSSIKIGQEKKTIFEKADEVANTILNDSSFTFDINKKEMILNNKITYKIENKDKTIRDTTINYGNLHIIKNDITNKNTKVYKSFNNLIQFLKDFPKHIKININNNFKIVLEFKRKINDEEKNNLYNINLKYKLQDKNIIIFNNNEDEDILNIKNLDISNGFLYFLQEIEDYQSNKNKNENEKKDDNVKNINDTNNTNRTTNENINSNINSNSINKMPKSNINKTNKDKYNKITSNSKNEYKIMEITRIDENYVKKPEFIYETKNGILISGGNDDLLYFNNSNFNAEKTIEIFEVKENNNNDEYKIKCPLNIYENDSNQNENNEKLDLIICTRIGLISKQINCKDFSSCEPNIINEEPCSVYFQNGDNNYIIAGENFIFKNYDKIKKFTFDDIKNIKGGIKINDNEIVFTSTTNLPGRKDKFIIYDIGNTTIKEKEIGNFSFTNSANSLCLMRFGELEDNILLCGCKKGNEYQKNGFLIMDMKRDTEDKIEFFDTENFEVYCFCPIFYINENKNKNNKNSKKEILYTDYFLVGGFSNDKREGMIKLFKILNNEDTNYTTKVEFKQDITFESVNFKYANDRDFNANNINKIRDKRDNFIFTVFRGNISCIMQSKINGKIYVTCWDGNIYKLTPPNISLYLKSDLEELEKLDKEKRVENLPN